MSYKVTVRITVADDSDKMLVDRLSHEENVGEDVAGASVFGGMVCRTLPEGDACNSIIGPGMHRDWVLAVALLDAIYPTQNQDKNQRCMADVLSAWLRYTTRTTRAGFVEELSQVLAEFEHEPE